MPNTIAVVDANNVTQTISTIDNTIAAAGSPTSNVQSIQGITGMTPVQISSSTLALDTSVNGILLGQGSTTSGEKGPLVQAAVTTSAPSYTTAQTSPLSMDTSGNLRVTFGGTVTVAGTVTANQGTANATPWNQNLAQVGGSAIALGQTTMANSLPVVFASNQSALSVNASQTGAPWAFVQSDRTATGTVTAVNNTVAVSSQGDGIVTAIVTADTNITLAFEGTVDGTNWVSLNAYPLGGGAAVTTTAANGSWAVPAGGLTQVRLRVTAAGASPTATISLNAGAGNSQATVVASPTAANFNANVSGTVTANQGGAPWSDNITQVGGSSITLGSKTSANSFPVVIASDQGAVPVSQSGSWSVTANAGTNLNTSALALDTSVNGILLSQGSTTSGQKGPLVFGAVTTNAPSYTTAQTDPLSLDTSGLLRVSLKDTPANTNNFNVAIAASSATVTVAGSGTFTTSDSHFPASVALADNLSNPTTTEIGANLLGWDATNTVWRRVQVDAGTGTLKVDGSGSTQPVSGTVTANQGGAPWSVVGTLTNNNAAPAANNVGALVGLAGSANPSYTNGDQVLLSTDLSGNLRVTGSLSVGGTTDESTFTAGTSTGTPAMGSFQTSVSALTNNQLGIIAVDANRNTRVTGFLTQNNAAPASTSLLGVMPAVASAASPSYTAGNQVLLSTDLSGNLRVTGSLSVGGTTDESAFTAGTSTGTPSMGSYQNTVAALANNQVGIIALDQYRNTLVNIAASVALPVYLDDRNTNYDDDGNVFVNPNVPGADIATGALQSSQLTVLQQIAAGAPVSQQGSWTVTANQGGAPWAENITQFGSNPVVTGTGASGVGIPRVTVSNDSNILATQSGSWAVTANAGTNLNTSALALDTSVNGILLSQGSTTSGEKGPLVQGAVTTSAPTYTTAQTSPLSLDTAGNLRVSLQASGATVTVSGTVTANQGGAPWSVVGTLTNNNAAPGANNVGVLPAIASSGAQSYTGGDQVLLNTDLSGFLKVNLSASNATVTTSDSHFPTSVALADNLANPTTTEIGANMLGWDATNTVWRRVQVDAATGTLKVDGSGSTQPVSGTVTANQGGAPWSVVGTLTNNNAAPAANNVGVLPAIASSAAQSYTSGDQVLLSTDLSGNLRVTGSLSVGGTTDEAAFTAGTSTGTPGMGSYQSTITPLLNNQLGIIALDQYRNTKVNIAAVNGPIPVYLDDQNQAYDDDGNLYVNTNVPGADIATGANQLSQSTLLAQIAAGAPVSQQGSWSVGAAVSNFPATQTVALAPAPVPIPVYLDDRNVLLDDNGIPFVNINLDGQDIATPLASIASEGGPTSLNVPLAARYIAGNAQNALPAANAIGALTGVMTDKFGRQVVLTSTVRDLVGTQTTTISASTSETTIVTAAALVFNDLVMLIVSNTSASTNTRIDFRDTTGGTVLFSLQSNGGQPPIGFSMSTPIPQTGVNTNWTATCATSTTDIRIYAVFAKNR